jgi:hypothetical protein
MPYPSIPRGPGGSPLPVRWNSTAGNWEVLEGAFVDSNLNEAELKQADDGSYLLGTAGYGTTGSGVLIPQKVTDDGYDIIEIAPEATLDTKLSSLETKLDTLLNSQDPVNDKLNVQEAGNKASDAVTITPDDSTDLAEIPTTGLYVGGNGDIKVDMLGGTTTKLVALKAGVVYPFEITRVYATGTTATDIVVLY